MTSGYWCKLRQVPLKVLPFCRVPVKFIGYLTRPLGFFFVSVDTEKVAKRRQRRCHAAQDRSWGLTFAEFCGIQRLIRDWGALRIYCRVPFSAAGIAHLFESTDDLYCFNLSSRWEYMKSYLITRNMLAKTFWISSGTRTAFPMGVAPEATAKCLYLVVGSPLYYLCRYIVNSSSISIFYRVRDQRSRWEEPPRLWTNACV